jgi:hypothetical protein
VTIMSQRPSKPIAKVAARARPHTPDAQVPAKPPVDIRSRARRGSLRPLTQPGPAEVPASAKSETAPQSYLQWAGFRDGTPNRDFGFGAYFLDQDTGAADGADAGTIRYTWTPARR